MIIDNFFNILLSPILLFLDLLPTVDLIIPQTVAQTVINIYSLANFILPMDTIISCISIFALLSAAQLIIAIVVRIKSFIPTMGA